MTLLKSLIVVGFLANLVSGCGGDGDSAASSSACANSPLVGSWSVSGQPLIFTQACTFSSSTCGTSGTYENSTASSGTISASVTSAPATLPAGCLALGTYSCTYAISNRTLSYVCH